MKPEEIIYWDQYSGLTQFCKRTEMKYTRQLEIYNEKIDTERVVQELFVNGFYAFEIRSRNMEVFAEPYMFYSGALKRQPRMNMPVVMSATFTLIEKTDEYVDVHLTEKVGDGEPSDIGFIKFQKNLTEPINGYKGKAAMIIHDVQTRDAKHLTLHALGHFALGVGLFVLGIMDGDWQRIGKDLETYLQSPAHELKTLKANLSEINAKYFELKNLFDEEKNKSAKQIQDLQRIVREQAAQISSLKAQNQQLKSLAQENSPTKLLPVINSKRDYLAEFKEILSDRKICVVGGNPKWQKKFYEEFTDAIFLENENFDEQQLKSVDLLIVNTNFVGHSFTKKAVYIAGQSKIKICYTSKTNLSNISKDILNQIQNFSRTTDEDF